MKELTLSSKLPIRLNFFRPPSGNFEKRNFRLSITLWKFHALLSFNLYPNTGINITIPIKLGLNANGDYFSNEVVEKAINKFSMGCGYNPDPKDKPLTEGYQPSKKVNIKPPTKPPTKSLKDYEGMIY